MCGSPAGGRHGWHEEIGVYGGIQQTDRGRRKLPAGVICCTILFYAIILIVITTGPVAPLVLFFLGGVSLKEVRFLMVSLDYLFLSKVEVTVSSPAAIFISYLKLVIRRQL